MLGSEQPSNLIHKTFILSPAISIWPFCGWAALLHMGVIGCCIWSQSTLFLPVIKEGSLVEVIEVDLTPTTALLPNKSKEEKETKSISATILSKMPRKVTPVNDDGQTQAVKISSAKPSLSLQIGNPHPPYPEMARENMIEGKVTVILTVETATGSVQDVQVISKDSPKCLIESVILTVKKWQFYPINVSGVIQETFSFEFLLH